MAFVLALTGRFLALSTLVLIAARILLPADFIESARLNRVSFINRHVRLLLPVSALTLVALAASLLALIMGELGATTLLSAPGTELISFRLHSRIHLGPESYIAAFSILYAAAVLFLTFLFWLAGNWVLHGRRSA